MIIEVTLSSFTHLKNNEEKTWVQIGKNPGNCYTSNKNTYFPITIEDPFKNQTLYCIEYNALRREKGVYPERKIQFALVGDSFTFGEGVKEEDTLAYLLSAKYPNINFKNFGKVGANVKDVYDTILHSIKNDSSIKHIIYFYNLNDALIFKEIAAQQKNIIDFQNIRWLNVKKNSNFLERLFSQSTLYPLLERAFILNKESKTTIQNYLDTYSNTKNASGVKQTLDLLLAMNEILKKNHIKFSIVIYPLLYKNIFGEYPFSPIHKFLINFCENNALQCIDAYPAFDKYYSVKNFTVHPVDYHPNGMANKLIINYLASIKNF